MENGKKKVRKEETTLNRRQNFSTLSVLWDEKDWNCWSRRRVGSLSLQFNQLHESHPGWSRVAWLSLTLWQTVSGQHHLKPRTQDHQEDSIQVSLECNLTMINTRVFDIRTLSTYLSIGQSAELSFPQLETLLVSRIFLGCKLRSLRNDL